MVTLNVEQLLKKKGKSKYWLYNQLNDRKPTGYTNFLNLVDSRTQSIKYVYIESLCDILECEPGDLIKIIKE